MAVCQLVATCHALHAGGHIALGKAVQVVQESAFNVTNLGVAEKPQQVGRAIDSLIQGRQRLTGATHLQWRLGRDVLIHLAIEFLLHGLHVVLKRVNALGDGLTRTQPLALGDSLWVISHPQNPAMPLPATRRGTP